MPAITVIGSINRDIVAYVERHPLPGETVLGLRSAVFPGGKGANQAVAAARLRAGADHAVRMIGRIGADSFGADMMAFLQTEGVDTSGVQTLAGAATGIALITVDSKAENAITVISGANQQWPDGLAPLGLTARDIVICQLEVPVAIVQAAFAQARAAKAMAMLNPAPYQDVPAALLALTDIVVLNEIELAQMLGRAQDEVTDRRIIAAARDVLARGPRAVIVTLGAAGALLVDVSGRAERISPRAVKAIDTTGAGDCFVGALAAELLRDDDILAATHFANRAAAISVTREGAAASMPNRAEVSSA